MRAFLIWFAVALAILAAVAGWRGRPSRRPPLELFADMARQERARPQAPNDLLPSGRGSQPPPEGTVARGQPFAGDPRETGRAAGSTNFLRHNPLPVTAAGLARGQEQFQMFCQPCHGALGDGNGITRRIGAMAVVASLHDPRIVALPDGEIFYTVSQGKNLMSAYGGLLTSEDRWRVVAYLRALQLTRLGTWADVPAAARPALEQERARLLSPP